MLEKNQKIFLPSTSIEMRFIKLYIKHKVYLLKQIIIEKSLVVPCSEFLSIVLLVSLIRMKGQMANFDIVF